jgi:hypothetical protein
VSPGCFKGLLKPLLGAQGYTKWLLKPLLGAPCALRAAFRAPTQCCRGPSSYLLCHWALNEAFENAARRICAPPHLSSVTLLSAPHYTVYEYARVHTCIYIYIYMYPMTPNSFFFEEVPRKHQEAAGGTNEASGGIHSILRKETYLPTICAAYMGRIGPTVKP